MVERLKEAIEKARQRRESALPARPSVEISTAAQPTAVLDTLTVFAPDAAHLQRHRVVSSTKSDPAHVAFDVLRTRLLAVCRENGWTRIGFTSPTKGCGKTTICVNLAYSLTRQANLRVLLMDLDLRKPSVGEVLGATQGPSMGDFLAGTIAAAAFLRRIEPSLIVGLGAGAIRDSAELLQAPIAIQNLQDAAALVRPDIVLYDLPPVLVGDDTIGFLGHLDAVIMVVAANLTRPEELEEAERLLGETTNLVGVLLNRCGDSVSEYPYEY